MKYSFLSILCLWTLFWLAGCGNENDDAKGNTDGSLSRTAAVAPAKPIVTPTKSETPAMSDRDAIEAVFQKLEQAYMTYLVQEDEPMFEFISDREAYIERFFKAMEGQEVTPHLSQKFLDQLRSYLKDCECDKQDLKAVRACAEPIFACERIMGKIQVKAVDAEAGEAVAFVHLVHPTTEKTACKVSVLLEEQDGVWQIMSRDLVAR